ncbi:hypothetical protein [Deinococcus multiflagellatus]|uniref:Uncharacterized protein n=1 Tax=Deinococcus multiflagellatus TaxID=1656887 RepID=A0ABW1ZQ77_9DEIO|nr:hypothetical protein [Deinococcus multiflagellatus]MBZ9715528.1 hypothetical protein [Deinococcus multiflagellatus]
MSPLGDVQVAALLCHHFPQAFVLTTLLGDWPAAPALERCLTAAAQGGDLLVAPRHSEFYNAELTWVAGELAPTPAETGQAGAAVASLARSLNLNLVQGRDVTGRIWVTLDQPQAQGPSLVQVGRGPCFSVAALRALAQAAQAWALPRRPG